MVELKVVATGPSVWRSEVCAFMLLDKAEGAQPLDRVRTEVGGRLFSFAGHPRLSALFWDAPARDPKMLPSVVTDSTGALVVAVDAVLEAAADARTVSCDLALEQQLKLAADAVDFVRGAREKGAPDA